MKKIFYFLVCACFAIACNSAATSDKNTATTINTPIVNVDMPDLNKPEDIAMDFKKAIFANDYISAKNIFLPSRANDLNEIEKHWRQYITDTADAAIFIGLVNKATCYKNEDNKNKGYCIICCDAEGGEEVIQVEKLDRTWYVAMSVKDFDRETQYEYIKKHMFD